MKLKDFLRRDMTKDPEVKKMVKWMKKANRREKPKRNLPCFPSVQSPFFVQGSSHDRDSYLGYSRSARLCRQEIFIEFMGKRMKEKDELRKERMKLKRGEKELKKMEVVNLAETTTKVDKDGNLNGEELMLDVSAETSSQVDQPRRTTSPYEQTGNLMVEGLKFCTTEAKKKTATDLEGISSA